MTRNTYVFAGPAGSAEVLIGIIEAALGRRFSVEPGSDPCLSLDSIAVYVSGHGFDEDDIEAPGGAPVPLRSAYPHLVDVRDTERDEASQREVADQIFAAIEADGRLAAVYIDDMQHVLAITGPGSAAAPDC
ncbi:MAG TPA: hypothetical protein VGI58_09635 [Streptosporangiaceae bacterium]